MATTFHSPVGNRISTTVAAARSSGATTLVVASGAALGTAYPYIITILRGAGRTYVTTLEVTGRGASTLTLSGVAEGATDADLQVGDVIEVRPTAGAIAEIHTAVNAAEAAIAANTTAIAAKAADAAVVHLTGNETVAGTKTFSSTIAGSITGNAATATNGVVTTGSYADPAWITALAGSKVTGNISGTAGGLSANVAESRVTGLVADLAGKAQALVATAVKTSSYTAAAGDLVPVDTTAGSVAITLPTAPADRTRVGVKHIIQGGTNAVTLACGPGDAFNRVGGATSATLTLLGHAAGLQYDAASAVWFFVSDDLPLSQLDLRYAALASPTFTGVPLAPTAAGATNTTQLATTAFVRGEIASLVNSAPSLLDTLGEIATALQADESTASALATTVAGKAAKTANLSDLADAPTARANLGLGTAATQAASAVAITGGAIDGVTIGATTPASARAHRPVNAQAGTSYTFVLGDGDELVTFNNASAVAATLPLNATVAYATNTEIDVFNLGAGAVSITPASGATVNGSGGATVLNQYQGGTLKKLGTNTWIYLGSHA